MDKSLTSFHAGFMWILTSVVAPVGRVRGLQLVTHIPRKLFRNSEEIWDIDRIERIKSSPCVGYDFVACKGDGRLTRAIASCAG